MKPSSEHVGRLPDSSGGLPSRFPDAASVFPPARQAGSQGLPGASASELADFIDEVAGEGYLRVEEDLGGGYVRLRTTEAERRQAQQDIRCCEDVVLELLRNARDAGARLVCVATGREGAMRSIVVVDDGEGIPADMWERVFEPRVTSKLDSFHADQWGVHGRGMALFSIASNTDEHRVMQSGAGLGCAVRVCADTRKLGERTDQSSLPRLVEDEGRSVLRGPRNINRIVAEFALAQPGGCVVYLGSATEVLATLVSIGTDALSVLERAFARDYRAYPVAMRPALAGSPEELAQIGAEMGLPISARSARRILDGQVDPLPPFLSGLELGGADGKAGGRPGNARSARGANRRVPMAAADKAVFAQQVKEAFAPLAQAYYLEEDVEADVRMQGGKLIVSIPVVPK